MSKSNYINLADFQIKMRKVEAKPTVIKKYRWPVDTSVQRGGAVSGKGQSVASRELMSVIA